MFICVFVFFAWLQSNVHVDDVCRKGLTDVIVSIYTWTEIAVIILIFKKCYRDTSVRNLD